MNCSPNNDPFAQTMPGVHEAVRKSTLLNTLHEKLSALPAGAFPFASEFVKLRDVIAPQIGDTRILFPEFTPHDEPLHVVKLFQLADKLFGARIYKGMNAAELFLLASALYAHDWGMAIGQDEKAYLRSGGAKKFLRDTFAPLPDEVDRLNAFVLSNGLSRGTDGSFPELGDQELRLYVRQTHARRSGARARAHFIEHPAVGEALAHLCEGHWHDFPTLDDPDRFPREYQVAGETAHLLALALQVRLIDLFHITDDRTPFALWRFVSPADRRSAEEWKKHRALHGVSVIDFPPGRAVKVQGFTEDEEVWASLQDLRRYCDDQIRGALDISARHVPQRYGLDFLTLDWAVPTGHLRPVDFRFEFDRGAMFRILSDDIYDGDRYVFLRELLQNSIDAIRTRRERQKRRATASLKKKQITPNFDTTIYFKAEHKPNGDITVKCQDFGIGMDEHIIRNYFTVAGVSYYRSAEFERQHLGFEPISRFGIGILSCFMVADKLKVKTYRDPECGPPMAQADSLLPGADEHRARRLSLEVPAVTRQFIVKELTDNLAVGTEIELEVLSQKVRKSETKATASTTTSSSKSHSHFERNLKITEYLCEIAGFVEFPILVEENWPGQAQPKLTLILHPDRDSTKEKSQYEGDISVRQLSKDYPWEDVFDLDAAKNVLTFHTVDLKRTLAGEGYEGWVTFPKPQKEDWDFTNSEIRFDYATDQIFWNDRVTGKAPAPPLKLKREDFVEDKAQNPRALLGVYRDGILLPKIEELEVASNNSIFPPPLIRINLPSSSDSTPNVSRTGIKKKEQSWQRNVWSAVEKSFSTEISKALDLPPKERLFRIGWLASVFRIRKQSVISLIPRKKAVSLWLSKGNKLELREGVLSIGNEVPYFPGELNEIITELVHDCLLSKTAIPKKAFKSKVVWEGLDALVSLGHIYQSHPLNIGANCFEGYLSQYLSVMRLQFLESPKGADKLLIQHISIVHEPVLGLEVEWDGDEKVDAQFLARKKQFEKPDVKQALAVAQKDPANLDSRQNHLLRQMFPFSSMGFHEIGFPVSFCEPFSNCWITRHGEMNISHPIGKSVMSCLATCAISELEGNIESELYNKIEQLFQRYERLLSEDSDQAQHRVGKMIKEFFQLIESSKIVQNFTPPNMPADINSVVNPPLSKSLRDNWRRFDKYSMSGSCGRVITKVPQDWTQK
jgi:hypothetical protein